MVQRDSAAKAKWQQTQGEEKQNKIRDGLMPSKVYIYYTCIPLYLTSMKMAYRGRNM